MSVLGGASRERVKVYANGWSSGAESIEQNIERALRVKEMGFTALKWDPFPGPWRSFVDRRDEDFAINYVRAMREALGPNFELLIEAHRRFAPAHAIREPAPGRCWPSSSNPRSVGSSTPPGSSSTPTSAGLHCLTPPGRRWRRTRSSTSPWRSRNWVVSHT